MNNLERLKKKQKVRGKDGESWSDKIVAAQS
jgi:hypothetical protein